MNYEPGNHNPPSNTVQKLTRLLAAPIVEPSQRAARIQTVEKDIILPLRLLIIAYLGYYFFFSGWLDTPGMINNNPRPTAAERHNRTNAEASNAFKAQFPVTNPASNRAILLDMQRDTNAALLREHLADVQNKIKTEDWVLHNAVPLKISFLVYAILNLGVGAIFFWGRNLSLVRIEWIVFSLGIFDAALMGTLSFISEGFGSYLYYVFLVLIVHNAVAIPVAFPQLLLNFLTSISFTAGGILSLRWDLVSEGTPMSERVERIIGLVAWTLCCYGIQLLFEKQKRAEAEATEFAVRQERLRTAGRLAAEIAHQIKNPLGIITNAAFCLHRSVHEGETSVDEQIQIIREEVERADQIITELMGYAQLAEGKVERLEVSEEIDHALQEVFPAAAKYKVNIERQYEPALPALLMQRRHLSGVLVNLLQNAREAMNGGGEVRVSARYGGNDSIRIVIEDNGPGIPSDKLDKIFEAYFTTREKGTGLGLAIVKHNAEMYGGAITVESKLGQGTRFAVEFPSRILMRLSK